MRKIMFFFIVFGGFSCTDSPAPAVGNSIELITSEQRQDSIFKAILSVTKSTIDKSILSDSLAFLVLPVQASCPACRRKTIDSIVKRQHNLLPNHFVIISAMGGRKNMNSYFRAEKKELPHSMGKALFLDSTNSAFKHDLYNSKPTIYYAYNQKVYKKVAAIPTSVREDLREFFSGYRNGKNQDR